MVSAQQVSKLLTKIRQYTQMKKAKTPDILFKYQGDNRVFIAQEPRVHSKIEKLSPGWWVLNPQGMFDPGPSFSKMYDLMDLGRATFVGNETFERTIQECRQTVEAKEWFTKLDTSCRRGFLLHGPPGTGKSTIANAICNQLVTEMGAVVIQCGDYALTQNMISQYRRNIDPNQVFVVWTDDLHAPTLRSGTTGFEQFKSLLEMRSKAPLFFFSTTNEFAQLDPALSMRPGRFDTRILVNKLPFTAFVDTCKFFHIEALAERLYKEVPLATPALMKEVAVRFHCFKMKEAEAITSAIADFEASKTSFLGQKKKASSTLKQSTGASSPKTALSIDGVLMEVEKSIEYTSPGPLKAIPYADVPMVTPSKG